MWILSFIITDFFFLFYSVSEILQLSNCKLNLRKNVDGLGDWKPVIKDAMICLHVALILSL